MSGSGVQRQVTSKMKKLLHLDTSKVVALLCVCKLGGHKAHHAEEGT